MADVDRIGPFCYLHSLYRIYEAHHLRIHKFTYTIYIYKFCGPIRRACCIHTDNPIEWFSHACIIQKTIAYIFNWYYRIFSLSILWMRAYMCVVGIIKCGTCMRNGWSKNFNHLFSSMLLLLLLLLFHPDNAYIRCSDIDKWRFVRIRQQRTRFEQRIKCRANTDQHKIQFAHILEGTITWAEHTKDLW